MKTKNRFLAMLLSLVMLVSGFCSSSIPVFAGEENKIAKLSVTYHLNSEYGNMIAEPYYADMPKGSSYEVASPEIDNYVLKDQKQEVVSGVLNEDTEIKVVYAYDPSKEAQYKINYIGVNNKGQETTLETVTGKASVNTVISIPFKEFKGYDKRGGDMQLTVTADGKAEKNIYYDKASKPYIIFNTNGSYIEPIMAEAGDDISEQTAEVTDPIRQGYDFAGWDQTLPTTMPDEDLIVNAQWTPAASDYTVLYWFQNIEDDGYSLNYGLNETRTALTGTEVTASEADIEKGKTEDTSSPFYGFDYSHADTETVKADGNGVLNVYYDREIWTINLYDNPLNEDMRYKDYAGLDRKLWVSISGKYGSSTAGKMPSLEEIDERYSENPFESKDYNYINLLIADRSNRFQEDVKLPYKDVFFTDDTFVQEGIEGTHEVDIFPYYSKQEQQQFHVSIFGQSLENPNEYELLRQQVKTGKANTPTNMTVWAVKGFTNVNGYYRIDKDPVDNMEWTSNESEGNKVINREPNGSLDGTYKFQVLAWNEFRQQRVKHTLTFQSQGETIRTVEDVYYETSLDDDLKLVPTNGSEERKFAGWYLNPDYFNLVAPTTSYKMPETDLTFYAKWEPVDRTVTFDTQGGTAVESQTVPHNGKAALPTEPTKDGYKFAGWYTGADDGDRWSFDRPVDKDITLYAHWRPASKTSYTVRHIMQGEERPFFEETVDGGVGDTIIALPLDPKDKNYPADVYLKPDKIGQTALLKADTQQNILTFTYIDVAQKDYTVKYLNKLTKEPVAEPKTITTKNTVVTEQAVEADNFKADGNTSITQNIKESGEIIFYYVPANLTVAYQFQSGTEGKELPEAVKSLVPTDDSTYTYGDMVTVKTPAKNIVAVDGGQWEFKGYPLQGNEFTIEDNTVITGVWELTASPTHDKGDHDNHDKNDAASNADKSDPSVKTGDSTNILLWSMAAVISFAGAAMALLFKRRRSK